MGLDMYMKKVDKSTGVTVDDEVAYWRKSNQIRNWIVNHTDYPYDGNLIDFLVTKENIEALIADCKKVLNNHNLASEILPTCNGFFFGSTDYDDWYFAGLKSTVSMLEDVLRNTDFETEEIYYTEWW